MTPASSRHEEAPSARMAPSQRPHSLRILLLSPIDPEAIDALRKDHQISSAFHPDPESLGSLVHDKDVLVFRSGVALDGEVIRDGA